MKPIDDDNVEDIIGGNDGGSRGAGGTSNDHDDDWEGNAEARRR